MKDSRWDSIDKRARLELFKYLNELRYCKPSSVSAMEVCDKGSGARIITGFIQGQLSSKKHADEKGLQHLDTKFTLVHFDVVRRMDEKFLEAVVNLLQRFQNILVLKSPDVVSG